eukprot:364784-Chlamydomonas_euryale.AAC.7
MALCWHGWARSDREEGVAGITLRRIHPYTRLAGHSRGDGGRGKMQPALLQLSAHRDGYATRWGGGALNIVPASWTALDARRWGRCSQRSSRPPATLLVPVQLYECPSNSSP